MQYRFFIIILPILMTLTSVTSTPADAQKVTLTSGGKPIFLHTSPVLVDNTVYVPFTALSVVGAKTETDTSQIRDGQSVNITSASGEEIATRVSVIDGDAMLPIVEIASKLGVLTRWNAASRTLALQARIESIEFDGKELLVNTSYPVTFNANWWGTVNRLILDIDGIHVPANQSDIRVTNTTDIGLRTGSRDTDIGRIVLDMPGTVTHRIRSPHRTNRIAISLSEVQAPSNPSPANRPSVEIRETSSGQRPAASISDITYVKQGPRSLEVHIATSGPVKYSTSIIRDPDQLIVDISDVTLAEYMGAIHVGHEILQGIIIDQPSEHSVRTILDLTRVVSFDVRETRSPNRLVVNLELPRGAGGLLSQKTIVIDPGHGGADSGAVGIGGLREKDSNLAIALRLQKVLQDEGAAVLMTRKTDVRLNENRSRDLAMRTEFARRHSADIFVSVHSNSVSGPRCPSGIMTFYHGRDSSSATLARIVQAEMVKAAGLPCMGHRSDFTLYNSGLAVLRGTTGSTGMPAILLEIGFVRHPTDVAKLRDPKFHQEIAEAITRGLKVYVEGNPSPNIQRPERPAQSSSRQWDGNTNEEEPVTELRFELGAESAESDTASARQTNTTNNIGPARPGGR